MVGRVAEREAFERWLHEVRQGRSACALIEGEAGIGKTTLADVVCASAAACSFGVLRGGADELDRGRPFGALGAALPVTPDRSLTSHRVVGAEFRIIDQLVEWVEERALQGPLAVVVEDLQWADPGTIMGLRAIGRRLAYLPVAVLGTFRPWPRSVELDRLIEMWRREGALYIALEPLDRSALVALVEVLLGASPGSQLERQLAAAAGNPLFIRELVGALSEDHAIRVVDGVAEVEAVSLPPSLQLTMLRRLGALGTETLSLLRSATVLGSTFSPGDLAIVSDRSVADVVECLLDARRAGVIEETDGRLRFRHDLVRDALYCDLPDAVRRALHREAGQRLARAGAPKLHVAQQLSLGAETGDHEAVRWLVDAAAPSLLRAPQTAVTLLERAAELALVDDPLRHDVLADLAEALIWSGQPDRGRALADDLLSGGVPEAIRDRARATVVRALWLEGRWRELVERVDHWLSCSELSDVQRAPLLADLAMGCAFAGDAVRAERVGLEALSIGEALSDDGIMFRALYALGPVYNFRGDYGAELAASERALAIVERGENPDLARFQPHFAHAMSMNSNDRYVEAEELLTTGLRVREELGTVWDLPLYQAALADLHCQTGRWDAALAEAETGMSIADEVGTRIGVVVCASIASLIRAQRDELGAAEHHLAAAEREIERSGPQWGTYWAALAKARIHEAHGDGAMALAVLDAEWDRQSDSLGLRVYLGPELVRLALAHDPARARVVADAVKAHAQHMTVAGARVKALICEGRVEQDAGLLEQAVVGLQASGWLVELAGAQESLAIARVQEGNIAAARVAFEEALELYGDLDARRDVARVLGAMRAAGLRRGSRAAHRRALKGWDALTAMESDVVRLCVDGLTNRQIGERLFISRRTVQTHLSHAFAKLDVISRVELAAAAARRGETATGSPARPATAG